MSEYDRVIQRAERHPLSQSLPSALRLALESSDQEFAAWIRYELLGYTSENPVMTPEVVVPTYRTVRGQWFDHYGRPLVLSDPNLAFVSETRLRAPVGELESFVGAHGVLTQQLPEFSDIIRDSLHVDVSEFRFAPLSVEQVLVNIRAHLLDRLSTRRAALERLGPKEARVETEILLLRPNLYGLGIDLRALWRRLRHRRGSL